MAISQKRTPTVTDVNTQRALQQVYEDINELINAINKGDTSDKRISNTGKSGDMRIRKTADKEYILELRTDEGWVVSTNSTPTGFKFQSTEDISDNIQMRIDAGTVQVTSADGSPSVKVTGDDPDIAIDINSTSTIAELAEFRFTEDGTTKGYLAYDKTNNCVKIATHIAGEPIALYPRDSNGNVGINTVTFDSSANGYLGIKNGTEPSAHTDDQIYIGSKDASTSNESTLALYFEEDPVAHDSGGSFSTSNKMKIWINGTEYYIALDAV